MPDAPPRALLARARELYAKGVSVSAILAETKLSAGTLYSSLDGGPAGQSERWPALPRRRPRASRDDRSTLAARLWRAAERQVREIENRLAADEQEPADRERDARLLSVLVRTVRELAAFDTVTASAPNASASDDDPDPPRDLDQFRRELAQRMDALVASGASDRVLGGSHAARTGDAQQ